MPDEADRVAKFTSTFDTLRAEVSKFIVGQETIIDNVLISIICGGHVLLEGVPGLGKTALVNTLAKALHLKFQRIQFTPDLLPADIVGTQILADRGGEKVFEFQRGPVFCNILLADEINRATPKTQSALLETMQEKSVTVANTTHRLDSPFFVLATQNPIEQDGTYPLPEAQLDRFFFNVMIDYPSIEEEEEIIHRTTGRSVDESETILDAAGVLALQDATHDVPLPDNVVKYILKIVHRSRPGTAAADEFITNYVDYGAGPRASQCLARASRALALLRGRNSASVQEVRDIAMPVLRHRVIPNYNATGEGIGIEDIIARLLD
ncbi:MAG: MoxR family ATPase [Verrucomicrobia bacterium]|nr:MoxR family ATPase [Verrucomicrobiota bacterium]